MKNANERTLQMRDMNCEKRQLQPTVKVVNPTTRLLRLWKKTNETLCPKTDDTFIDDEGVRRYVANWRPVNGGGCDSDVAEDIESGRAHSWRLDRGCVLFDSARIAEISGTTKDLTASQKQLSIMYDYKAMWNHLALEVDDDTFGENSLLFEMAALFFFDSRTIKTTLILTAYNITLYSIGVIIQPKMLNATVQQIIVALAQCYCYCYCASVYKASLSDSLHATKSLRRCRFRRRFNTPAAVKEAKQALMNSQNVSWWALVMLFVRSIGRELRIATRSEKDYAAARTERTETAEEVQAENHAEALRVENESLKCCECAFYLLMNVGSRFLRRHTHETLSVDMIMRYLLLFFLVAVPALFLYNFTELALSFKCGIGDGHKNGFFDGENCTVVYWMMGSSLGLTTMYFMYLICTLGVVVAIIGLELGAQVFRALVHSWINRFAPLRRVNTSSAGESTAAHGDDRDIVRSVDTEISASASAALVIAVTSADEISSEGEFAFVPFLERDAFEHYLLIHEYARQSSNLWSPALAFTFLLSTMIVGICLYCMFASHLTANVGPFIGLIVIQLFFMFLPVYCLASANQAIDDLRDLMGQAAMASDYAVIGGRDLWMDQLRQHPAYWTVFGFPVTSASLVGLVSSIVGAVGAYLISQAMRTGALGII